MQEVKEETTNNLTIICTKKFSKYNILYNKDTNNYVLLDTFKRKKKRETKSKIKHCLWTTNNRLTNKFDKRFREPEMSVTKCLRLKFLALLIIWQQIVAIFTVTCFLISIEQRNIWKRKENRKGMRSLS